MSKPYKVSIKKDNSTKKKMVAVFYDKDGNKIKTVRFGADGYSDFTKHKDEERKKRYIARHKNNGFTNPMTANTLSRYVLWNKPTLSASISDFKKRFNLK